MVTLRELKERNLISNYNCSTKRLKKKKRIISKQNIDNKQENSKYSLFGDRDDTVNLIISQCSKLAKKKYQSRHDWLGKVIHWKFCKKLKYHYPNKLYMHKPESVFENETHKIFWDFEMQTAHAHRDLKTKPSLNKQEEK